MKLKFAIGVVLSSGALFTPVHARKPFAADQAAVRQIIAYVYKGYSRPIEDMAAEGAEAADDRPDAYQPPYTETLGAQVARWSSLMKATDELYNLNSFDWYCQCQDFDSNTARVIKQSYQSAGKDRIDANILFPSAGSKRAMLAPPCCSASNAKAANGNWTI